MGMLDGLLGSVLGSLRGSTDPSQPQSPLLQAALQILQQNGGIDGIVEKFRHAGYGSQADSWVSTGENQPIASDAVQQALGSGVLGDLASRLGMSNGAIAGGLAAVLPQLVDRMTPQGQVPANHNDLVAEAIAMLQRTRTG
jgi:uncharacterized protein YidB (DUF937 family)